MEEKHVENISTLSILYLSVSWRFWWRAPKSVGRLPDLGSMQLPNLASSRVIIYECTKTSAICTAFSILTLFHDQVVNISRPTIHLFPDSPSSEGPRQVFPNLKLCLLTVLFGTGC